VGTGKSCLSVLVFSEWRGSGPVTVCNGRPILSICLSPLSWFVRAATIYCHQIYIMSIIYIISLVHFCSPSRLFTLDGDWSRIPNHGTAQQSLALVISGRFISKKPGRGMYWSEALNTRCSRVIISVPIHCAVARAGSAELQWLGASHPSGHCSGRGRPKPNQTCLANSVQSQDARKADFSTGRQIYDGLIVAVRFARSVGWGRWFIFGRKAILQKKKNYGVVTGKIQRETQLGRREHGTF
jgi:hypothetical protein